MFGSSARHPWTCWYPNNTDNSLLSKNQVFLVGNVYMYTFKSFDLNLLMAHCGIFLKTVQYSVSSNDLCQLAHCYMYELLKCQQF